MFTPPNIIYIEKFDFERAGAEPKNKFLIVLMKLGSEAIVAPLTTSKDYVPDHYKSKRCIKDDPACIHCYFIPKTLAIGRNGFFFIEDTYVHIHPTNLKKRSISYLKSKYEEVGAAILKDSLIDSEYSDFLYCLYKSNHVPRGIRKAMEPIIQELEEGRAKS